jgi:8-oxo-dGTP pyrophosphatase MutT (NUDIX family)
MEKKLNIFSHRIAELLQSRNPRKLPPEGFRPAAVLVPIQEMPEGEHLVFIQRAPTLSTHGGEIAFPGGIVELEDSGPWDTALRESSEEIGLDPKSVTILGELDQVTTASVHLVTPVVGLIPYPCTFRISPWETARVFAAPIERLMAPDCLRAEESPVPGRFAYHFYFQNWDIWGATARITKQLLELAYGFRAVV